MIDRSALDRFLEMCGPAPLHAITPGTRIIKVKSEDGDFQPVGTVGTCRGCIHHPKEKRLMYVVQWDVMPDVPVAVIEWKIARLT